MISNKKFFFNYLATFWAIVSSFVFLPFYLKLLGPEWFGILSIGAMVQSVLVLFDSGITTTLKREYAASSDNEYKNDLLYSFEKIVISLFSIASLIFILVLPYAIDFWFEIDPDMISKATTALQLFVVVIATQVLFFFYNGGIWGQDQQERSSILKILFSVFKNGIVVFVLMFNNSIITFILWQIVVSIVFVILSRYQLIRLIPTEKVRSAFFFLDKDVIYRNMKFAGGMFLISVLSMINYQVDKIVLSSQIAIDLFGFYTIGFMLSQAVVSATSPIGHSIFPQMTAAIEGQDFSLVKKFSLEGFTMICILSLSASVIIFFSSEQILLFWTGNDMAVDALKDTVPLLVIGSFLQSLQFIPYHLAIALKNTKSILMIGLLNLIIAIPLYVYMIGSFGMKGAGLTWVVFNLITTPLFYYFIVGRYLGGQFILDILLILLKIVGFISITYLIIYLFSSHLINLNTNLLLIGIQVLILVALGFSLFLTGRVKSVFSFLYSKL